MVLPGKLVFVDLETTGLSASSDRIIEVAVFRVENGRLVETFHSLIDPEVPLPLEIESITGIRSDELQSAPNFSQIARELVRIFGDAVFVAHNVRFDYSFIKSEFARLGYEFKLRHLCTAKLSRYLYPTFKKHDLSSVIARCGFDCENRHRAFDDAKVLWEFYQKIQNDFPAEQVRDAVRFVMKRPSRPLKVSEETLNALPETPGVYIFYGENHSPLYVGKSINIRDRVLSHFVNDLHSGTEMKIAQQVEDIETRQTIGEVGALLLESELIKTLQPLYNRRGRHAHKLIVAKHRLNADGYETVDMEAVDHVDVNELPEIVGLYRSKRQAKDSLIRLATQFDLCEKLLGLEKTTSACFGSRLGRCRGACQGDESPDQYNVRFLTAVSGTAVRRWPYSGPIMIEERDFSADLVEYHIVDRWCYLGTLKYQEDLDGFNLNNDLSFDVDVYKILYGCIDRPRRGMKIHHLPKITDYSNQTVADSLEVWP